MTTATLAPANLPAAEPLLLDARAAAALLAVSPRHLYRLADGGRCPLPVRLGAAVRWRRADLLAWLDAGCPVIDRRAGR